MVTYACLPRMKPHANTLRPASMVKNTLKNKLSDHKIQTGAESGSSSGFSTARSTEEAMMQRRTKLSNVKLDSIDA